MFDDFVVVIVVVANEKGKLSNDRMYFSCCHEVEKRAVSICHEFAS